MAAVAEEHSQRLGGKKKRSLAFLKNMHSIAKSDRNGRLSYVLLPNSGPGHRDSDSMCEAELFS